MRQAVVLLVAVACAVCHLGQGAQGGSERDGAQPGYGDSGQGGYGPRFDKGQEGYGPGDMTQEGYGQRMQEQILQQSGIDSAEPYCSGDLVAVTKRGFQFYVNLDTNEKTREANGEYGNVIAECVTYTNDICLMTCGMTVDKCKTYLRGCMAQGCKAHHNTTGCWLAGNRQAINLKLMQTVAFSKYQEHSCDCVNTNEVVARRKEELTNFYQKWAPEKMYNVQSLVTRYSTNWPAMMFILRQKYRQALHPYRPSPEEKKEMKEKDKENNVQAGSFYNENTTFDPEMWTEDPEEEAISEGTGDDEEEEEEEEDDEEEEEDEDEL